MEWQEARAADGRLYWHNTVSKQSVWEKPDALKSTAEKALDLTPWKQYTAAGGRQYYVHSQTKETTWDMPDEVSEALNSIVQRIIEWVGCLNLLCGPLLTFAGQAISYA